MNGNCGSQNNVYIGARYVPRILGEWSADMTYEPLDVVLYQGTSYTSRTYVPKGIIPSESTQQYWALTGNYNAQVEMYRQEVEKYKQDVDLLKPFITKTYDTTQNLIEDRALKSGEYLRTNGFNEINDGGNCFVYVSDTQPEKYYFTLKNGLYGCLMGDIINVDSIGCQYDNDISIKINDLITMGYKTILFSNKIYKLINSININNSKCIIDFNHANIQFYGETNALIVDGANLPAYRGYNIISNCVITQMLPKQGTGLLVNKCADNIFNNCRFTNFKYGYRDVNGLLNTFNGCGFIDNEVGIYRDLSDYTNLNNVSFNYCKLFGNYQAIASAPTQHFGNNILFKACEIEGNSNEQDLPIIDLSVPFNSSTIQCTFENCWFEGNKPYLFKLNNPLNPVVVRDCVVLVSANQATNFAKGENAFLIMENTNDPTIYSNKRYSFDDNSKLFNNLSSTSYSNENYDYTLRDWNGATNKFNSLKNMNFRQQGGSTTADITMTANMLDLSKGTNNGTRMNCSFEKPIVFNGQVYFWSANGKLRYKIGAPTSATDGNEIAIVGG